MRKHDCRARGTRATIRVSKTQQVISGWLPEQGETRRIPIPRYITIVLHSMYQLARGQGAKEQRARIRCWRGIVLAASRNPPRTWFLACVMEGRVHTRGQPGLGPRFFFNSFLVVRCCLVLDETNATLRERIDFLIVMAGTFIYVYV